MASYTLLVSFAFILHAAQYSNAKYVTHFMGSHCTTRPLGQVPEIKLTPTGPGSAIKLGLGKLDPSITECRFMVSAPESSGILIAFDKIKLRACDTLTLTYGGQGSGNAYNDVFYYRDNGDYNEETHRRTIEFLRPDVEFKLSVKGQELGLCEDEEPEFRFVLNSYHYNGSAKNADGLIQCPPDMYKCKGDFCIWDGLTCDDHKNCYQGDDEKLCTLWIWLLVSFSILALIIAIAVLIYIKRELIKNKVFQKKGMDINENVNGKA